MSVGGAPVPPALTRWLERLYPNSVTESYGNTEASGIYSNGIVFNSVEVKLVDWEDYTNNDLPYPRGEVSPLTLPPYNDLFRFA